MIEIREAVIEDLPAILEIYNDAILTTTATFDLEEETLEGRTAWFLHHGDKYPLIVAVKDNHVVGYCCLSQFQEKPAYNPTSELSIYISAAHRGEGIGGKLMEDILFRAPKLGFHAIISGITAGNEASIRLHEKFGFSLVGTLKEVGYKFGEWQDVCYYELIVPTT